MSVQDWEATMKTTRRSFLAASMAVAGTSAVPGLLRAAVTPANTSLKLLILGGTGFIGPHTVRYALERGHDVTLFNRGKTNDDLFPQLETIIGNRDPEIDAGLSGLEGRQWDAVIDNSGFVPRITGASSQLLADNVGQYVFVSTICQYADWMDGGANGTEERPRAVLDDPTTEDVPNFYCELKAYAEMAVEEAMPGRVTQIRPGLIVGPGDGTDRFTYWPVRVDRGGEMLAPGKPADLTQYIDARDLGQFMVHCVENQLTDSFNLVRPPMPFGDFLGACNRVTGMGAELTWVPADFLAKHDVEAWRDVTMWADSDSPERASLTWSSSKALAAGLTIRPVEETIRDTLEWFHSLPQERQAALRTRMTAEREEKILAAWHAANA